MEPYLEFIGTLQNGGFWLVKVCIEARSPDYVDAWTLR